jgi:4-hydroxybenzoate polyprenyltransferase
MPMKQRDVDFFRPMWRRVVVTAICVIWAALEAWHGEETWIVITLGLTAYAVWTFFIAFPKDVPVIEDKGENDAPPQA